MYGIAIAALGMLSNLSTSLAIDAYGPISDNAGGIAEMSGFEEEVREITDSLDAAGNTTAAVGKGFAIGSACLVSLALFGAFITRTGMTVVNILDPIQISCLIVGAMMPYAFSAFTMKSVGLAATQMCEEVDRQFKIAITNFKNDPKNMDFCKSKSEDEIIQVALETSKEVDSDRCIKISTEASLTEMILPGVLVNY